MLDDAVRTQSPWPRVRARAAEPLRAILRVMTGLFTSPIAFVLSGLMAAAYFKAHAPDGFWPLLNRGELAALYCFVFLAFRTLGGGRYSVDGTLARRTS